MRRAMNGSALRATARPCEGWSRHRIGCAVVGLGAGPAKPIRRAFTR
ncbi:MAG: hypothetical protein AAGH65_05450 [Pseudomonadota bacterium]